MALLLRILILKVLLNKSGEFLIDNYYGENFASDSKMKYQNNVKAFKALVDGTIDIFFIAYPSSS